MEIVELKIKTTTSVSLKNITSDIQNVLDQRKKIINNGVITVFIPHTTAAVTVNETADPSVCRDLESAFKKLVPNIPYEHMEGNSPAHLLSSLVGTSIIIPVKNNRLELGTWQGILFCEFDGPRTRTVIIAL